MLNCENEVENRRPTLAVLLMKLDVLQRELDNVRDMVELMLTEAS